ncbi:MAG: hypothetical protein JSR81_12795 [Proteobacteria bacterium]|nr:hypothetical protein [Pseudomonadota bacterium]
MRISERILGALLVLAAVVTAYYWWDYFTGGDVMVLKDRWYTAFESSFPVADGWLSLCALIAGIGFFLGRRAAPLFGLMAASAFFYLAAMDITFDVENGLYAMAAASDAMKFEIFINVSCLILGAWTLAVSWRKLR